MDVTKATDKPVKNFLPIFDNSILTPLHLAFFYVLLKQINF